MASQELYYSIDFSGKLVTVCEPMILKPGDFTVIQNVRYVPNGYGGTTLRGIAGITKFNTNAATTYLNIKSAYHFATSQPFSTHLLAQALDVAGTAGRIIDNTTAVAGTGNGDFSATALYTLTNVSTGRFNALPDQSVGFSNGYDCVVWGGDEYRIGRFINLDYVSNSFNYDGTDLVKNNLTTEYVSIKSVASETTTGVTAKLLLHGNATPLVDSGATVHALTLTPGATGTYSTTQKKFGTGSILFDGTNDKITGPAADHADFNFNGAAWTIDFWFKIGTLQAGTFVTIKATGDADDYIECSLTADAKLKLSMIISGSEVVNNGSALTSATIPGGSAGLYNWHHAAITQNATVFTIFIDGNVYATCTDDAADKMANASCSFIIGADHTGSAVYYSGYIDELAIWKSAKYTAAFTPPASEYAPSVTATTLASMYVASSRALSGVKLYVGTANDATSSLYDVKEWNGTDWASCTTQADGTTAGGISLAQTGVVSWDSTVTTSKPRMLYNTHAYWYLLQFVGLNNTTYPTVYYCTVKAPMQTPTDMWDGIYKQPTMVWREMVADEYKDLTTEVLELDWAKGLNKVTAMRMNSFATTDALYVGSVYRLQGIKVAFRGEDEDDADHWANKDPAVLTTYYWNGTSWVANSGLIDGTIGGDSNNISFHHGGTVTWTPPTLSSEYKKAISNDTTLYYYKFQWSATLDAKLWVDQIQAIPAAITLRPAKFMFAWQQRTVLINEYSGYQDKVMVSSPYSTSVFNGENSFETRIDDALLAGTAVHTRYDNSNLEDAILCSKTKTYLMTGSSVDNFKVAKISDVYGCINPNTMRTCSLSTDQGKREVAIWLSQVGIVMYDGGKIQRIDDDIRDKFTPNHANVITYSNLLTAYADFDERFNEYWFVTTSSTAWVYNVEFNRWWYCNMAPATGTLQGVFPVYESGTTEATSPRHQHLFGFSSAGFLFRMNNGNTRDTGTIVRTITTSDFPLIKVPEAFYKRTELDFIVLYLKVNASADSMTLTHYGDSATSGTTISTNTQTNTGYAYKELRSITSNTVATSHILHKFQLSMTADDVPMGLEPLLMSIRYRVGEFKDT